MPTDLLSRDAQKDVDAIAVECWSKLVQMSLISEPGLISARMAGVRTIEQFIMRGVARGFADLATSQHMESHG